MTVVMSKGTKPAIQCTSVQVICLALGLQWYILAVLEAKLAMLSADLSVFWSVLDRSGHLAASFHCCHVRCPLALQPYS